MKKADKKTMRICETLNNGLLSSLVFTIVAGSGILVGLIVGLNAFQIMLVLTTGFACLTVGTLGFEIHRKVNLQIKKRIKLTELRESRKKLQNLRRTAADLNRQSNRVKEELRASQIRYWRELKFGTAIENELIENFFQENQIIPAIYNTNDGYVARESFEWFCRCAVEFYQSKGFDISELLLTEFEKRLYLDGLTDEFYDVYWTNYFITEAARMNAVSTILAIRHFADCERFEFPDSAQPESEAAEDNDGWAEYVEVNAEYFKGENKV